ncbi:MAG: DUF2794 domain-containing protein [Hyphomicrobiales bacterium]|nr:DUF2794 domain-containing protein [Hyphomicrobiales bacterium]
MSQKPKNQIMSFQRLELHMIQGMYGRGVAAGVWKDYAIDIGHKVAIFSIYRNASEVPIYQVIKDPNLRHKQGQYRVVSQTGQILRRGDELKQVLKILDKFQTHLSVI